MIYFQIKMSLDEKVAESVVYPVKFKIGLNAGINADSFKKKLEDLAGNSFTADVNNPVNVNRKFEVMDCYGGLDALGNTLKGYTFLLQTDPEIYIRVFNTELSYQMWKVTCVRPPPIILEQWVETKPHTIPESLKEEIRYVQLEQESVIDGIKYDLLRSEPYKSKK